MTIARAVAYRISFPLYDSSTGLLKTGATPAATVSKDGGAYAAVSDAPVEIGASGTYELTLTATEMTADLVTVLVTAAGALSVTMHVTTDLVQASVTAVDDFVDTEVAAILAAVDTEVAAIKAVTDALPNAGALSTIQGDLDDVQTRLPAALVGGRMDSDVAVVQTAAITAGAIATDAIGAAELAADAIAEIQSGLATAAALATVQADTDDIQTRLPAALVGGRMDSDVAAVQAGAITAGAIATDAIGAAELAADAVTEIQSGLATAAALATVQADTDNIQTRLPAALVGGRMDSSIGAVVAGVLTDVAFAVDAFDKVFSRALSAVEGSATGRSLAWAIAKLVNKVSLAGSTLSIKKTDDAADMFTQAVATNAGQAPVISVDTN